MMNSLMKAAIEALGRPLGTVLHIGADDIDLVDEYTARLASRIILVNGDADVCSELRDGTKGNVKVHVLDRAIGACSGTVAWYDYTPRAFSGLLEADRLRLLYPRLSAFPVITVEAVALENLVRDLQIQRVLGYPNVLVLDTPGIEGAMMRALPSDVLTLFHWVIAKGGEEGLYRQSDHESVARSVLADQHYTPIHVDRTSESLWPLAVMQLDRKSYDLQALAMRNHELEQEVAYLRSHSSSESKPPPSERETREQLIAQLSESREKTRSLELELRQLRDELTQQCNRAIEMESQGATQAAHNAELQSSLALVRSDAEQTAKRMRGLEEALWSADGQLALLRDMLRPLGRP